MSSRLTRSIVGAVFLALPATMLQTGAASAAEVDTTPLASASSEVVANEVLDLAPKGTVATKDLQTPSTDPVTGALEVGQDVSLPADGEGTVEAAGFGITLPEEAQVEDAEVSTDDLVVYPAANEDDASVAVAVSAESLAIHTVIPSAEASSEYTYELSGATPQPNDDGSISLLADGVALDVDGSVAVEPVEVGRIDAPWAVDADGQEVATRYEIRDGNVVQVIEFDATTKFPVVADPSVWWWTQNIAKCAAALATLWGPGAVAKLAKIKTLMEKNAKLKAAIAKAGGLKKALALMLEAARKRGKISDAKMKQVKDIAKNGGYLILAVISGSCVNIVKEIV